MSLRPKNAEAIEKMRAAGRVVAEILQRLEEIGQPGVTTAELEAEAVCLMKARGARSLFLGQPHPRGGRLYPGNICVSVNEELVHGIPGPRQHRRGRRRLGGRGRRERRLVRRCGPDVCGGRASERVAALVSVTDEALRLVRREARAGVLWSAVAGQIENLVVKAGFSVVTEYVGHGIGRKMWEDPRVPNYVGRDMARDDFLLVDGLTIAVEPMVNMGRPDVRETDDGWTVVTCDGKPAAHFEDTFVIRREGAEPLTRLPRSTGV